MTSLYSEFVDQRTEQWFADRLGKPTASRMGDLMSKTKTGYGAGRKNYMAELVIERLTGEPTEHFVSKPMQRGIELEPDALAAYEVESGNIVEPVGFCKHRSLNSGASPDGIVGKQGMVEVKCPNTATHLETLLSGKVERQYILQMQWGMICTQSAWCDFISYDDRLPGNLRLFIKRIPHDTGLAADMIEAVTLFIKDLDTMEKGLRALA